MRAPWLTMGFGLILIIAGMVFGIDALRGIGVIVGLLGGGLYMLVLARADRRSSTTQARAIRDANAEERGP